MIMKYSELDLLEWLRITCSLNDEKYQVGFVVGYSNEEILEKFKLDVKLGYFKCKE